MTVLHFGDENVNCSIDILSTGYLSPGVAGTVVLARVSERIVILDPGMVPTRQSILSPLSALGIDPDSVSDVVISHHHPDHTINIALFRNALIHDFQATYINDSWTARKAEGAQLAEGFTLLETPGHTPQDISVAMETTDGLVIYTHLWWTQHGPEFDKYSVNQDQLAQQRQRVLNLNPAWIIPGHGEPFKPDTLSY